MAKVKKDDLMELEPVFTAPAQNGNETKPAGAWERFLDDLTERFSWLRKKMREADMHESARQFMQRVVINSLWPTLAILIAAVFVIENQRAERLLLIPVLILAYLSMFFLMVQEPKARALKRKRELEKDLLFAGRHLWISLKGSLPLFDSLLAISKGGYGLVSKEMNRIVERVVVGVPLDTALQEIIEDNPSPAFRRMMLQMVNSVRSGADVGDSLGIVLEQISREQLIDVKEYGQKLNPIVMFYMVMGVIFPSLGISVGILILSFAGVRITMQDLLALIPLIAIVQYMFLSYIDVTRPTYEI